MLCGGSCLTLAQRAEMRPDGRGAQLYMFRLYLDGVRTPVNMGASDRGEVPEIHFYKTKSGILCGNVTHSESGANIKSDCTAFIRDHGRFLFRPQYVVSGSSQDAVLLVPNEYGPWTVVDQGYVYRKGRLRKIGLTSRATIDDSDTIWGWYWCDAKRKPYRGTIIDLPEGGLRQQFIWKNGRRRLTNMRKSPP